MRIIFYYLHNDTIFFFFIGTQNESRIEFTSLPGRNRISFDYSLEFKTHYPDGLLFYTANKGHIDFAALYLKEGKVSKNYFYKLLVISLIETCLNNFASYLVILWV